MFIAHLPAGYLLSKFWKDKTAKYFFLTGSILPDLDLIYFYTIGERAIVHHAYPTHMPYFWLVICLIGMLTDSLKTKKLSIAFVALFAGTILHLFLDTFTGGIYWLAPFSDAKFLFFNVPSLYPHWTLNFILHWTFWLEIIITLCAGILFFRQLFFTTKTKP